MYFKTGSIAVVIMHIQIVLSQDPINGGVETETPYQCKKELKLKCTYTGSSSCCTALNRVWRVNTNNVLINGNPQSVAGISVAGKYREGEINDSEKYFILIIENLEKADLKNSYTCSYGSDSLNSAVDIADSCQCLSCALYCSLYAIAGIALGFFAVGITKLINRYQCKPKLEEENFWKKVVTVAVIGLLISVTIAAVIGNYICPCLRTEDPHFIFLGLFFGVATLFIMVVHHKLKDASNNDDDPSRNDDHVCNTVSLAVLTLGTWLCILKCSESGKSQSVESGSSCWPICRVGQDPNTSSSDPEKVRRSPEKERADKKKERKPTEVVRPQPSRPLPPMTQHLKTDNTGRAEYSTENEMFKPRPLPNISGHSDSPRPLPKRTPDDQLEKGGIQLEPLVDSTSERKKKKKRKKKETKQSDEDD